MSAGAAREDLRGVLSRELDLLVERLRPWTTTRWAAAVEPWGGADRPLGSRADVGHHLAVALAAPALAVLAAAGRAPAGVEVPRLPHATALPDQVAVLGQELLDAVDDPEVLRRALAEVLLHRADLDGAAPGPQASALAAPGLSPAQAVARWRADCPLG